jgi:hypothetical protein
MAVQYRWNSGFTFALAMTSSRFLTTCQIYLCLKSDLLKISPGGVVCFPDFMPSLPSTGVQCVCGSNKFHSLAEHCLKANCTMTEKKKANHLESSQCRACTTPRVHSVVLLIVHSSLSFSDHNSTNGSTSTSNTVSGSSPSPSGSNTCSCSSRQGVIIGYFDHL